MKPIQPRFSGYTSRKVASIVHPLWIWNSCVCSGPRMDLGWSLGVQRTCYGSSQATGRRARAFLGTQICRWSLPFLFRLPHANAGGARERAISDSISGNRARGTANDAGGAASSSGNAEGRGGRAAVCRRKITRSRYRQACGTLALARLGTDC
jgi:hypothetical protein